MNKEQQIEEITFIVLKNTLSYTCAKQIAENLYNAGYRKTFTSDLASDTQKAFKEGYEKAHAEVGKEFAEKVGNSIAKIVKILKEYEK